MSVIEDAIILAGLFSKSDKTLPFYLVNDYVQVLTTGETNTRVMDVFAF
jgi:hypothetical protein